MKKKRLVVFLVLAIVVIYGAFLSLDWLRFFQRGDPFLRASVFLSRNLKLATTALNLALVFIAAGDAAGRRDSRIMGLIFVLILVGDALLLQGLVTPGVVLFLAVQILLMVRNGAGLAAYFSGGRWRAHALPILAGTALVVTGTVWLNVALLGPLLGHGGLFPLIAAYSLVFGLSLWIAWMSLAVASFQKPNALLIALGMTLFYVCDINVGIGLSPDRTSLRLLAENLIWFFYTPALTLLALSVYDFRKLVKG
jgi:hypothetical protein